MHTFSVSYFDDKCYMDSRATFHMMENGGNLTSYFKMNNNINVCDGYHILVTGCGHMHLY